MKCPRCKSKCRTVDSRQVELDVRRRHHCLNSSCKLRFSTLEIIVVEDDLPGTAKSIRDSMLVNQRDLERIFATLRKNIIAELDRVHPPDLLNSPQSIQEKYEPQHDGTDY